jgi:hypothetical protein
MDMYGMEQIDEMQQENEPSIEDVKKIVDSKRLKDKKPRTPSKTYTKEDRIKNLQLAREKKKSIEPKKTIEPIVKPLVKLDPQPTKYISEDILMEKSNSSKSTIKETYNNDIIINELKNLVMTQNEILEKLKTKPKRNIKVIKPKIENKTLDLTITDDEIKRLIETKEPKNKATSKPNEDMKLKAFLDALIQK